MNVDEIIKKTIEKNGKVTESVVCMEECAELAQAISKEIRGKHDKEHLVEEIADVCICIELLKEIYDITDNDIHNMGIKKLERLEKRLKEKE